MTLSTSTRKPGVYLDENVSNAIQGLFTTEDNVCIIAQKLSTGTADSTTAVKCFSDADAALYLGAGSVAHLAVRAAFEQNPSVSGYTVLGVDDAGGAVKAQGQVDLGGLTGLGGKNGTLKIYIGDEMISANYTTTSTPDSVVADLVTDSSSISNILPVVVTGSTSTLAFEAKNAGRVGNMIPIKAVDTDNGTSYVVVTAMTSGAGDPDVGNYGSAGSSLSYVVGGKYTVFVNAIPNNISDHDSMTKIQTMVTHLSGQVEQAPCIQVLACTDLLDTYSDVKLLCNTHSNAGRATCAYLSYAGTNGPATEYYKVAAAYAADLVAQSDPALPYNGDVLVPVAPPSIVDRLTRTVQEDCLHSGVTPLEVIPGEQVAIVKAITTYVYNGSGNPDATLLNVNTYRVLDYVRAQVKARLEARFRKSKITTRILKSIVSEITDVLYLIQVLEIVKDVDTYKAGITAVINSSNPSRVDVEIPTPIVSPLDIIAGELKLIIG